MSFWRLMKDSIPDEYSEGLKQRYRELTRPVARWRYRGNARYCPICNSAVREFQSAGVVRRPNARCPVCGSLERHRLVWLYLIERTNLLTEHPSPKKLLHIAPEHIIAKRLRPELGIDYLSADLTSRQAMIQMDITDIPMPDDAFNVIICNHVLEHIVADSTAIQEVFRVLEPGGWALLQVPIKGETTIEDPSVQTPEERLRVFGQRDHVRRYGRDYPNRLMTAGFNVTVDRYARHFDDATAVSVGIDRNEDIYYCTKPC